MFKRSTIRSTCAIDTLHSPFFVTVFCAVMLLAARSNREQPTSSTAGGSTAPSSTASAPQGGGDFEGAITVKIEAPDAEGMEVTYFIKNEHSRIETSLATLPDGQAVMLWDASSGKLTTLMPQQKMYMTMDLKGMAEEMKGESGEEKEPEFPKLTATGRRETIAGHTCEHWLMGDKPEYDICVAKGLGYFGIPGGGGIGALNNLVFNPKLLAAAAAHPEWVQFLEGGAFPLKMTVSERGQIHMHMEATKIERKSLDDSLFTVPADYKEFEMPKLPGQ